MLNNTESNGIDEIHLSGLFRVLWLRKWVICAVACFVTLIAVAYVVVTRPIYEARAFVISPTQNDIANINFGRTRDAELAPFSVKDVYSIFLQNLKGEALRQSFIYEVILPELGEDERKGSKDLLYSELSKSVVVSQPAKDMPDRYMVSIQSADPLQAAQWAQDYVSRAGNFAKQEIIKDVTYEAEVRARNLERKISDLRENSKKVREDTVTKLREALRVAEAIGLEKPPIISGNPAVQVAGSLDGQLIYMRGTKALKAEIENLEARKSDDPFIRQLRGLEEKYGFYKSLPSNLLDVSVYRLDGSVEPSSNPIKPKRTLIVILSMIFGVMIGVALVLIRHFSQLRSDEMRSPT